MGINVCKTPVNKVFCNKCIHFKLLKDCKDPEICFCPKNIIEKFNYKFEWNEYKNKPSEINKSNNCKWFKPFEKKSFLKRFIKWMFDDTDNDIPMQIPDYKVPGQG